MLAFPKSVAIVNQIFPFELTLVFCIPDIMAIQNMALVKIVSCGEQSQHLCFSELKKNICRCCIHPFI